MRQLTLFGLQENDIDAKTNKKRMYINRIHRFDRQELKEFKLKEEEISKRISQQDKRLDTFCQENGFQVHIKDFEAIPFPGLHPYQAQKRPTINSTLQKNKKMSVEFLDGLQVSRVDIQKCCTDGHVKKIPEVGFDVLMSDLRVLTPKKLRQPLDRAFQNGFIQTLDSLIAKLSRKELFPGEHKYLRARGSKVILCGPEILRNAPKKKKETLVIKLNRLDGLLK